MLFGSSNRKAITKSVRSLLLLTLIAVQIQNDCFAQATNPKVDAIDTDGDTRELLMADENLDRTEAKLKDMENQLLEQLTVKPSQELPKNNPEVNKPLPAKKVEEKPANPVPVVAEKKSIPAALPINEPVAVKSEEQVDELDEVKAALDLGASLDKKPVSNKALPAPAPPKKPATVSHTVERSPDIIKAAPGDTEQKLQIAESQIKILSRELEITRKSLKSSEQRIQDLSGLVRAENEPITENASDEGFMDTEAAPTVSHSPAARLPVVEKASPVIPSAPAADSSHASVMQPDASLPKWNQNKNLEIATIGAAKAPLRIGPSVSEATLYLIPKDSKVLVELRTGQWFRVITTNGTRGWINRASLLFDVALNSDSTVKVSAYNPKYEPAGLSF